MEKYEIFKYKGFRVCLIQVLGEGERDIKEGLAIEHATQDGHYYYVIAFVRYDEHEGDVYYEPIGNRIEECTPTWDDVKLFRECLRVAENEVYKANTGNDYSDEHSF